MALVVDCSDRSTLALGRRSCTRRFSTYNMVIQCTEAMAMVPLPHRRMSRELFEPLPVERVRRGEISAALSKQYQQFEINRSFLDSSRCPPHRTSIEYLSKPIEHLSKPQLNIYRTVYRTSTEQIDRTPTASHASVQCTVQFRSVRFARLGSHGSKSNRT